MDDDIHYDPLFIVLTIMEIAICLFIKWFKKIAGLAVEL